jgi:DNA-binding GntR family transcriptional regulator
MSETKISRRKPETLATKAYQLLRRDITGGEFKFGQKLNIQMLCDRYEIGLAPLREALNRASVERLVTLSDHRGFYVTPISESDLDDILKSRIALNEFALRESIRNGGDQWEESILLAHHKLGRIAYNALDVDPAWETAHRVFHAALLSACTAPTILAFCEQLFDAADRYRHLARHSDHFAMRTVTHKMIAEATLARKEDEAVALLTHHMAETADLCREQLRSTSHVS